MSKIFKQITLDDYLDYYYNTLKFDVKKRALPTRCWFCYIINNLDDMIFYYIYVKDKYSSYNYTQCGRFCDENCINLYILNDGKGVYKVD
jgi:hypothetical protein